MVRKAQVKDVKEIYGLIESFATKGDMLHRPQSEIYANLRDFFVYGEGADLLGVCALHICWEEMAEIRSLCVKEGEGGKGIGRELVAACLNEAKTLGVKRVFALTYKSEFFEKMNFRMIDKSTLPHKIWNECVKCIKFPTCDENAVMIELY